MSVVPKSGNDKSKSMKKIELVSLIKKIPAACHDPEIPENYKTRFIISLIGLAKGDSKSPFQLDETSESSKFDKLLKEHELNKLLKSELKSLLKKVESACNDPFLHESDKVRIILALIDQAKAETR